MILLAVLFFFLSNSEEQCSGEECPSDELVEDPKASRTGGTLEDLDREKFSFADYYPKNMRSAAQTAMGVKFRSFHNQRLYKYWDDGSKEGVYTGFIDPMDFDATMTYDTHTFIYRDAKYPNGKEILRITMRKGTNLYIIPPNDESVMDTDVYKRAVQEKEFMEDYYSRTGQPWLADYGRGPTLLPIWESRYVGQEHNITSEYGFVHCEPVTSPDCLKLGPINLTLTVLSTQPKVLVIPNLMSHFEADHIRDLAKPRMIRSAVGKSGNALETNTRTSKTAWVSRTETDVMDHIYSRFADVLGIPNELLTLAKLAEHLQVVEYQTQQEYKPHHDFGSTGIGKKRYATLLLSISDIPDVKNVHDAGGHTGFPKAFNGLGLRVRPPKGGGVLFYSALEDGNADDYSLHAGMPVRVGMKYICNLWIWDPSKSGRPLWRASDNHWFDKDQQPPTHDEL